MKRMVRALLAFWLMAATTPSAALPWREVWQDMNGAAVTATQPGDKHLVFFWGTWCGECREKLRSTLPRMKEKGTFGVWTVNLDKDLTRAKKRIVDDQISVPVLRDPDKRMQTHMKFFSVPQWAVFKRTGGGDQRSDWQVVASGSGFDEAEVQKALAN